MRAVSCIVAAVITVAVVELANTCVRAQSADLATADKTPKVRKDKTKPVKKPDKNQYWLLNPTPPDQMRSFNTDRPTKANVPYTVDAGHFQYETDLVNFTHQVTGSVHTDTVLVPNPTFKVGVTNNADLEVNVPFAGVHTFGSSTQPSSSVWGIGDTFVRPKVNLWGNDGGSSAGLDPLCQSAFRADWNRQRRSGRRFDCSVGVDLAQQFHLIVDSGARCVQG
jgi:Putative MetA-pathway of phenol degradation